MTWQPQEHLNTLYYHYDRRFNSFDSNPMGSRLDRLRLRQQKTHSLIHHITKGLIVTILSGLTMSWPFHMTAELTSSHTEIKSTPTCQYLQPPTDTRMTNLICDIAGYGQTQYTLAPAKKTIKTTIVVNIPSRTLDLYEDNQQVRQYPVAVGKPSTPTPLGKYTVSYKEMNPAWYPPRRQEIIPSGPNNPLGYRWMEFAPTYGIHGTNAPSYIGAPVSNGCIRLDEENIEELYAQVRKGTAVKITYDLVKIDINKQGQAVLGIYPDIYGYGKQVTALDIQNQTAQYGITLPNYAIQQVLDQARDHPIPIAQFYSIKVNGQKLANWTAVSLAGIQWVPIRPVAAAINAHISWDSERQIVTFGSREVPGIIQKQVLYITDADIQFLFGGFKTYWSNENCLEFVLLETALPFQNRVLPDTE